jgi:hypothetical protein
MPPLTTSAGAVLGFVRSAEASGYWDDEAAGALAQARLLKPYAETILATAAIQGTTRGL